MLMRRITPSWLSTPRVCWEDTQRGGHRLHVEKCYRSMDAEKLTSCCLHTWLAPPSKRSGRNSSCRTVRTCVGIWITRTSCLLSRHHRWSRLERPPAARLLPSLPAHVRSLEFHRAASFLFLFLTSTMTLLLLLAQLRWKLENDIQQSIYVHQGPPCCSTHVHGTSGYTSLYVLNIKSSCFESQDFFLHSRNTEK